jgi:hypothetical protein
MIAPATSAPEKAATRRHNQHHEPAGNPGCRAMVCVNDVEQRYCGNCHTFHLAAAP